MAEVSLLPSKTPFSKRFEDAVGQSRRSTKASRVPQRFGLAANPGLAIDQRNLGQWIQARRKLALRHMGVDKAFLGKKKKLIRWRTIWTPFTTGLRMRVTQSISRSPQNVAHLALKHAVTDDLGSSYRPRSMGMQLGRRCYLKLAVHSFGGQLCLREGGRSIKTQFRK
jgi:hypothetical protein